MDIPSTLKNLLVNAYNGYSNNDTGYVSATYILNKYVTVFATMDTALASAYYRKCVQPIDYHLKDPMAIREFLHPVLYGWPRRPITVKLVETEDEPIGIYITDNNDNIVELEDLIQEWNNQVASRNAKKALEHCTINGCQCGRRPEKPHPTRKWTGSQRREVL